MSRRYCKLGAPANCPHMGLVIADCDKPNPIMNGIFIVPASQVEDALRRLGMNGILIAYPDRYVPTDDLIVRMVAAIKGKRGF